MQGDNWCSLAWLENGLRSFTQYIMGMVLSIPLFTMKFDPKQFNLKRLICIKRWIYDKTAYVQNKKYLIHSVGRFSEMQNNEFPRIKFLTPFLPDSLTGRMWQYQTQVCIQLHRTPVYFIYTLEIWMDTHIYLVPYVGRLETRYPPLIQ